MFRVSVNMAATLMTAGFLLATVGVIVLGYGVFSNPYECAVDAANFWGVSYNSQVVDQWAVRYASQMESSKVFGPVLIVVGVVVLAVGNWLPVKEDEY